MATSLATWAQLPPPATQPIAAAISAEQIKGQTLYDSRCFACHSENANRAGPMHRGILGRKAGGVAGFMYSQALQKSTLVWTQDTLNAWLKSPESLIPGQAMNVSVADAQDRAALVAYLMSLK